MFCASGRPGAETAATRNAAFTYWSTGNNLYMRRRLPDVKSGGLLLVAYKEPGRMHSTGGNSF